MDTTKKGTNVPTQQDEFLSSLQNRLLSQSGMISSQDTNIEKTIADTIASTKASGEQAKIATESAFDRKIQQTKEVGGLASNQFLESGRGQAINQAAYGQMQEDINTELKDLDQRKQEAMISGDVATASKVADLQMKSLEFRNESMQRSFTNLLSTAGFALSASTAKNTQALAEKTQSFQEKQAKASVALQYGVTLSGGETLDEVITKVAPFASQEQKMKLAQMQSSINASNAQIAQIKAATGNEVAQRSAFNKMTDEAIAMAISKTPDLMTALIKTNPERAASVSNASLKIDNENAAMTGAQAVANGEDLATAWTNFVATNTAVSPGTYAIMKTAYDKAVTAKPAGVKKGLIPQLPGALGSVGTSILESLFGTGALQTKTKETIGGALKGALIK